MGSNKKKHWRLVEEAGAVVDAIADHSSLQFGCLPIARLVAPTGEIIRGYFRIFDPGMVYNWLNLQQCSTDALSDKTHICIVEHAVLGLTITALTTAQYTLERDAFALKGYDVLSLLGTMNPECSVPIHRVQELFGVLDPFQN